jgi:single-strand DNA-binding protein
MALNHTTLEGNLTRDPEMRYSGTGQPIAKFSIATNEKSGGQEHVSYTDCTTFGKSAEFTIAHLVKGKRVIVEGRLRQERWDDRDGRACQKHGIIVDKIHFVGPPQDTGRERFERAPEPPRDRDQGAAPTADDNELPF